MKYKLNLGMQLFLYVVCTGGELSKSINCINGFKIKLFYLFKTLL